MFCQCGTTTKLTAERAEFFPLADICAEISDWLKHDGIADVITFAGSGEPTLYSRLGELIAFIKEKTTIPVILLSNGTLLHRADVRAETALADIVKISLSAWDEESFRRVNGPAPEISFDQFMAGAKQFRREFSGELRLEVFLMDGVNSAPEQVKKIAATAEEIMPDKIQLNTAVRPVADPAARAVDEKTLESFCELFTPHAEIIAAFGRADVTPPSGIGRDGSPLPSAKNCGAQGTERPALSELIELIRRHPSTAAQLALITGAPANEIKIALQPLVASGELTAEQISGEVFYR